MRYIVAPLSGAMSGVSNDRYLVIDTSTSAGVSVVCIARTQVVATGIAAKLNASPL